MEIQIIDGEGVNNSCCVSALMADGGKYLGDTQILDFT